MLLLISFTVLYANHIKWQWHYEKALQEAQKNHKVLMVLLIKNNCSQCKKLMIKLFMNQKYIDTLNQNVIAIIVNPDTTQNFPREMYWSTNYPTLFFVNSADETFLQAPLYNPTQQDIDKTCSNFFNNFSVPKLSLTQE